MAENTAIAWTDSTFNPWVGCTPISAACDGCYAEEWAKRTGQANLWQGDRRRTTASNWHQPVKWNKQAASDGKRRRVFCASLADVFDNQVPEAWRSDLWDLIRATPHLDWLLLTKRPQNIARMLPADWDAGWDNVWIGTTTEDQAQYDRRWAHLSKISARVRFISYEPALGPLVDLGQIVPDWIIAGGESGPKARRADPVWFSTLREICAEMGIAFFFKQWGGRTPTAGGCELEGVEIKEWPIAA